MSRSLAGILVGLSLALGSTAAAARPPVSGFVPVPGGKLFYEERGAGPPVILIHGGMLDHRMWDPQGEALARHHRVIRYDVASHGRSPAPETAWKNFEHLDLLMQALKVDRASLVGLSLGGRIAIDFAIAHPEKVRALVLVDPGMSGFPFTGRDWRGLMADRARARQAGDAGKVADVFMRTWLAGPHRTREQVDPAVWRRVREMAVPNALSMGAGQELEPPAVGRLDEIKAPVLEIEGELDCEDIHLITRLVERRVAGTRRVVIPGVAHMPNLERPAEVNRLLVDFLRQPPLLPAARPALPAQQEMVDVEGGRLWAERVGEGEPLVLIHDGIVHAVGWDDVLPSLASQFQVIRYDRRGYGRSTAPQASFSPLADLEAVVRHFGANKVHLMGSSAGGGLAIDFALVHPEQVSSLTLVGAVVSGFPYTSHFLGRGGRLTPETRADAAASRRYWTGTDPYFIAPESKAVRERVAKILEAFPQNLEPGTGRLAVASPPALPRLASIRVPTLVLVGEHDIPDVHAHAGAITAGIPGARREVVEGAGHVPYLEQPDRFVATVLPFLQSAPFLGVLDAQGAGAAAQALAAARATDRAAILASEEELNTRGYRLLASGSIPEAIAVFRLNAEAFPASANVHDSLGEALLAAGDREKATAAYRRALELDPASASAWAALRSLGALVLPAGPRPAAPGAGGSPVTTGGGRAPLALTYVANTGVLVASGGKKVLIDALFDKPNPDYRAPAAEDLQAMTTGAAPFDGVHVALVTHNHPDHFDAGVGVRFLENCPDAVLVAPSDAVAEMQKVATDWERIAPRVIPLDVAVGSRAERQAGGVAITALRTQHSGNRDTPMNLMYLVELDGWRIFHEGDSPGSVDDYRKLGLGSAPIDLAVVHFWFPLDPFLARFLQEVLQPAHIALMHLPVRLESDAPGKIDQVREQYGDIFLLLPGMPRKTMRRF